jgi:hypothetical protein
MAVDEIRLACAAMYAPNTDPATRQRAGEYLEQASAGDDAWPALLQLVTTPQEQAATRFWAASALFRKARREPPPPALRAQLVQELATALASDVPGEVAKQVSVACATLALRTAAEDPSAVGQCTRLALELCGRSTHGLGLLKALADEAPNVDAGAHRIRPLRAELQRVARSDVFPALLQATGVDEVLAAWLQHGSESSLHDLLGGVDAPAFSKLTSVRTAVSTLIVAAEAGGGQVLDDASLQALRTFLGQCRQENDADCLADIARLTAALAASEPHGLQLAQHLPEVWDLALTCVEHPSRRIGAQALDAFLVLQDIPVAQRHPALTRDAFARLLVSITRSCSHSTDDDEDPEDALFQFRAVAADVLVATYFLLREVYMRTIADELKSALVALTEGGSPERAEAALYVLRVARREVCSDLKGRPDVAASARESVGAVLQFAEHPAFGALFQSGRGFVLCAGACDLLGAFAPALQTQAPNAVTFLSGVITHSQNRDRRVASAAGQALCRVCSSHSKVVWSAPDALRDAITAVSMTGDESACSVVEGVARAASHVSVDVSAKTCAPLVDGLKVCVEAAINAVDVDAKVRAFKRVVHALQLCDTCASFAPPQLRRQLAVQIMPILSACHAPPLALDEIVVGSALRCHASATLKEDPSVEDAQQLANVALVYWEAHAWAASLEALAKVVDACAGRAEGAALLSTVAQRVVAAAARHATPSSEMFSLLVRLCALAPSTLSAPSEFCGALWAFCIRCLGAADAGGAAGRAAANLLGALAKRATQDEAHRSQLGAHGAAACREAIRVLAGPAPSQLRPALSECLHAVAAAAPSSNAVAWLGDALGDDALFDAKLPVGERRRVHAALCALVAQKPRFKALVVDLAKISNGETSLDAILAYEIAPQ